MKLFGLIGYPLGHSFSKQYFTEKFRREGLDDCSFEAFPIKSISEFNDLIIANPELKGLGVTIPYKQQVLQFVHEQSEEVKYIGATNSIRVVDGKLTAFNTDITGFEQSFFSRPLPAGPATKALVLGTGGASRAVQYVLRKAGIDFLVVTRNQAKQPGVINYEQIGSGVMQEYRAIINCTPVGTWPAVETAPALPYELIGPGHYLYDLVYKPEKTRFLQLGEEQGATIQNGYDMLVIQAEASWIIWNGG
jgi:shikimate dehydrogenase